MSGPESFFPGYTGSLGTLLQAGRTPKHDLKNLCLDALFFLGILLQSKTLRVQVPNHNILAQNLYYNDYHPKPMYLIIGYMDPLRNVQLLRN